MQRYVLQRKELITTATGCLSKAWYTDTKTGEYLLAKGNSTYQIKNHKYVGYEPYSEVMASRIANVLGVPHISYSLRSHTEFPEVKTFNCDYVSVCKEYHSAKQRVSAYNSVKVYFDKDVSDYWTMYRKMPIDICELYQMLLFDAIIGNVDRHLNNWELEWTMENGELKLKSTPLFDSGASLLALVPDDKLTLNFKLGTDLAKPFKSTHVQQMKLIEREYPALKQGHIVGRLWGYIYAEIEPILKLLPEKRAECITQYVRNRLYYFLEEFV